MALFKRNYPTSDISSGNPYKSYHMKLCLFHHPHSVKFCRNSSSIVTSIPENTMNSSKLKPPSLLVQAQVRINVSKSQASADDRITYDDSNLDFGHCTVFNWDMDWKEPGSLLWINACTQQISNTILENDVQCSMVNKMTGLYECSICGITVYLCLFVKLTYILHKTYKSVQHLYA